MNAQTKERMRKKIRTTDVAEGNKVQLISSSWS